MNKMSTKKRILLTLLLASIVTFMYYRSNEYNSPKYQVPSPAKTTLQFVENTTPTNSTTIVTAFFGFRKSKHSSHEYESWINNFLPYVETPVVVFTDNESASFIKRTRQRKLLHLFVYDNVWDMPSPIRSLKHRYERDQHELDPERDIHSGDLYAIWNAKSWMVNHTTELNPFNSTYFYWVDIGAFRTEGMRRTWWPASGLVDRIFEGGTVDKLHVFLIRKPTFDHNVKEITFGNLTKMNLIVGGFFGGTLQAIRWWSEKFYETHNAMMNSGFFVGKDQTIMNYILLTRKSKFFVSYMEKDKKMIPIKNCDDVWFYFVNWYSIKSERTQYCPVNVLYNMEEFYDV